MSAIVPNPLGLEAGATSEPHDLAIGELVRRFGVNPFAAPENGVHSDRADANVGCFSCLQERIDGSAFGIVLRDVLEVAQIEVAAKLAIDTREQVAIEGGGHGMGGWRAPEMQHWKPEMVAWLQKTLNVK